MVVLGDPVDGSNPGRGPRFIPVSSGIYRKVPQSARICKAVRPFDAQRPRTSLYLTVDVTYSLACKKRASKSGKCEKEVLGQTIRTVFAHFGEVSRHRDGRHMLSDLVPNS